MKKNLLSLMAVAAMAASAQTKLPVRTAQYQVAVDETTGAESLNLVSEGDVTYYDAQNHAYMTQGMYMRNIYTYNANGSVASATSYSWSDTDGWTTSESNITTYEYDAEGNIVKQVSGTGSYSVFSGYEHGQYTLMENYSADGTMYYSSKTSNKFNEKGQLIQRSQYMKSYTTGVEYEYIRNTYTYNTDGTLHTEAMNYLNEDGTEMESNWSKTEYFYTADGLEDKRITESNSRYGLNKTQFVTEYATFDAKYVVKNVKAVAGANNTVTVTWDAVAGAEGYVVVYDKESVTVEGTSYTTNTLLDGEHQFYVQAVINGVARNISDVATASVKDTGKLPAENFEVLGVEQGEDEWGGVCYNVKIKFTLPTTTSTITDYSLSYGDGSWDKTSITDPTVDGSTVTATVSLSQYSIGQYNSETYEYDLRTDVPLSVIITYATGNADKSNVVVYDFVENKVNTAVVAPTASALPATYYSVSGAKSAAAQRGINIVKMSDGSVKKVLVK